MTREVPVGARRLASRLAALFVSDSEIVVRLNDAQHRLRQANDQLWSGLHPGRALSMAICFSPSAAIFSPHWWPCFLPAGGDESPHPQRLLL